MATILYADVGRKLTEQWGRVTNLGVNDVIKDCDNDTRILSVLTRISEQLEILIDKADGGRMDCPVSAGVVAMLDSSSSAIPMEKLGVRARGVLKRASVFTWAGLKRAGVRALWGQRNCGKNTVAEILQLMLDETGEELKP